MLFRSGGFQRLRERLLLSRGTELHVSESVRAATMQGDAPRSPELASLCRQLFTLWLGVSVRVHGDGRLLVGRPPRAASRDRTALCPTRCSGPMRRRAADHLKGTLPWHCCQCHPTPKGPVFVHGSPKHGARDGSWFKRGVGRVLLSRTVSGESMSSAQTISHMLQHVLFAARCSCRRTLT